MVSQPKTHNSIRVLPVSQQAVELLMEEHKKHPGNPYMFPSPKTGGMFWCISNMTHPELQYHRKIQLLAEILPTQIGLKQ